MNRDIGLNDILAFILEVAALALWGLWAWSLPRTTLWKVLLTAGVVGGLIAIWALFFARTAEHRLAMPWLFVGKLLLLLPAGLLYFQGKTLHSVVWAALVLLHLVVGAFQKGL